MQWVRHSATDVEANLLDGRVISRNQTAFIPERLILDGVVILQEVLHDLKSSKKEGIILKLDFEKAYDRVSWNFLEEVLLKKGFSFTWVCLKLSKVVGLQLM